MRASWLKGYHWEDLANLHVELGFLRHRLIVTLNDQIARQGMETVENLERFAQVDDLLADAGLALENAKCTLFDICYERSSTPPKGGSKKN